MGKRTRKYSDSELESAIKNSNSWKEVMDEIGLCGGGSGLNHIQKLANKLGYDHSHLKRGKGNYSRPLSEILVVNSPYLHGTGLKRRLWKEKLLVKYCQECAIYEWQGKPAPLQLHHINGISNDNRIENLEILCANCHALTENYCGGNLKFRTT